MQGLHLCRSRSSDAFSALACNGAELGRAISPTGLVTLRTEGMAAEAQARPETICEASSFAPSQRRKFIIGHQLVNAD